MPTKRKRPASRERKPLPRVVRQAPQDQSRPAAPGSGGLSSDAGQTGQSLFRLPQEIRDMIYDLCLESEVWFRGRILKVLKQKRTGARPEGPFWVRPLDGHQNIRKLHYTNLSESMQRMYRDNALHNAHPLLFTNRQISGEYRESVLQKEICFECNIPISSKSQQYSLECVRRSTATTSPMLNLYLR